MSKNPADFRAAVQRGYASRGDAILLGAGMLDGQVFPDAQVQLPLRTMNRHGLISGATGTGKTKTLALIAEGLSAAGVPVVLMDIKGDLSGVAMPGENSARVQERHAKIGAPWAPSGFPVEFLTLSHEPGARLRATVHEFGPILFSKMLGLNETQSSLVSLVFKFCDDKRLPLLDLKDFKKVLEYITGEAKEHVTAEYGLVPTTSISLILRKLIELEQQGADLFFGERSFEVADLMRTESDFGVMSILRLTDVQDRPKLFSSFMLQMLGEIYATLPEAGDLDKPKLVLFIDEAHLIFEEAEPALLQQIETVIKLIRSKGVGIFFCTQMPTDIPNDVLAQLGMKVQHALRAFTAKDRKDIKLIAQNYPLSDFYDVETVLTSLGIGEAFVTVLDERGVPTPLVATLLCAPRSRMGSLTADELNAAVTSSPLATKYNEVIDARSAYEILGGKLAAAATPEHAERVASAPLKTYTPAARSTSAPASSPAVPSTPAAPPAPAESAPYPSPSSLGGVFSHVIEGVGGTVVKQIGRTMASTVTREVARSILGVFGLGGRRR